MVHALSEARRVLKPNSILVDLRPAIERHYVGILRAGRHRELGRTRERFDLDRAANRAVAHVLARRLFRQEWRTQFECDWVFATLGAFREWIREFIQSGGLSSHDWLIRRVANATRGRRGETKIVARAPLVMRVLTKEGTCHGGRTAINADMPAAQQLAAADHGSGRVGARRPGRVLLKAGS
jgi:hypothetical protein